VSTEGAGVDTRKINELASQILAITAGRETRGLAKSGYGEMVLGGLVRPIAVKYPSEGGYTPGDTGTSTSAKTRSAPLRLGASGPGRGAVRPRPAAPVRGGHASTRDARRPKWRWRESCSSASLSCCGTRSTTPSFAPGADSRACTRVPRAPSQPNVRARCHAGASVPTARGPVPAFPTCPWSWSGPAI